MSSGLFFPFSLDEQEPLIYDSLSFCLQTHRKLDWIADSERCRYGALHWTAKTVSICCDLVGSEGRQVTNIFCVYCSRTVLQVWKRTVELVPLLIPVSHQVACVLTALKANRFPLEMKAVIQLRT